MTRNNSRMTEKEKVALDNSGILWNSLTKVEYKNEDDLRDLRYHIHAIQNIILALPEQFDRK